MDVSVEFTPGLYTVSLLFERSLYLRSFFGVGTDIPDRSAKSIARGVNPITFETIEFLNTAPHYSTGMDVRTIGEILCKLTNTTNREVAITLQGATFEDPYFINLVDLVSNIVPAGTTTYVSTNEPVSYLIIKAEVPAVPTSGTLDLVWEFKHGRD
jgi:hypothetical protein